MRKVLAVRLTCVAQKVRCPSGWKQWRWHCAALPGQRVSLADRPMPLAIISVVCSEPQTALWSLCAGCNLQAHRDLVFKQNFHSSVAREEGDKGGRLNLALFCWILLFLCWVGVFFSTCSSLESFFFLEPFKRILKFLASVFTSKGTKSRNSNILSVVIFTSHSWLEQSSTCLWGHSKERRFVQDYGDFQKTCITTISLCLYILFTCKMS